MRIGLFSDTFPPDLNGVANSTAILRDELMRHGHEVFVIRPIQGVGLCEWDEKHHILGLSGLKVDALYGYVLTSPIHVHALSEVRKLNLDIIHVQTEFGIGIFARTCARQLDIPLVSTYHTQYEDYTHYVNFMHLDAVDNAAKEVIAYVSKLYGDTSIAVITPSNKTKEMLLKYGVNSRIFVVPTGLQLERFSPELEDKQKTKRIREKFGLSSTDKLIIYVGRIAKEKALDLVLEGFAKVNKMQCKARLLIVGGGPDLERLQEIASGYGLNDSVFFAGPVPSSDVPDYYRAANAFVSASLSETQGMTFIEAMASGLPLFARKDDVLEKLLIDNHTGWYFDDSESFSQSVMHFCELENDQIQTIQNNCLNTVFPWSSNVFYEKVLDVYEYAINEYHEMKIVESVKVKGDSVQLILKSATGDDQRIIMSLDDYYTEGIKVGGKISYAHIERIEAKEAFVRGYEACLRKLSVKDRTRKELLDYLSRTTELEENSRIAIVNRLEQKGFVDDHRYCVHAINSMKASFFGKNRIEHDLTKKGISHEMIAEVLGSRPDDEEKKGLEYAEHVASSIHEESVVMKKRKIEMKLIRKGYSSAVAKNAVSKLDFSIDKESEDENLQKCAAKALKRYKKKHSGMKLRNMVYRYCASQGYTSSDIYRILEEMEWNDDKN